MLETPPAVADEQSALRYIEALIKNYEPGFDLQRGFTPGVFGCSDPEYPAVRNKWLDDLDRRGLSDASYRVSQGMFKEVADSGRARVERSFQDSKPADSRLNWRVTVHHGENVFHIMAVDKNFERYALELQTEGNFERDRTSDDARPNSSYYEVVNQLSELKPILDNLYQGFKRKEEDRKRTEEESRQQERIDKAVSEEREKGERELTLNNMRWWTLIIFIAIVVIFALLG
jgi:hypothetical protein